MVFHGNNSKCNNDNAGFIWAIYVFTQQKRVNIHYTSLILKILQNIIEKSRNEIKESAPRSLVEYETDMNVRLQREKQIEAVMKLRDMRLVVVNQFVVSCNVHSLGRGAPLAPHRLVTKFYVYIVCYNKYLL